MDSLGILYPTETLSSLVIFGRPSGINMVQNLFSLYVTHKHMVKQKCLIAL